MGGGQLRADAFASCHPAVNLLYFLGAIGFAAVIQHPAYLAAGAVGAGCYYLLLRGRRGWRQIGALLPLCLILTAVNPLFNTRGEHILGYVFDRPYTAEALGYGAAIAGVFGVMLLWFGCYNAVLTGDKFTSLFGSLAPALSLLLVMVLRLVPNLLRKAGQITHARRSIGKGRGEGDGFRQKLAGGMTVLSALTDWALEGSVVTADSMRARGYGTGRRTGFQIYRMTARDWALVALILALACGVIAAGGTAACYTPSFSAHPLGWGFGAYCLYLALPSALHSKEALQWRILRSKI